jgi:hypothetical protein
MGWLLARRGAPHYEPRRVRDDHVLRRRAPELLDQDVDAGGAEVVERHRDARDREPTVDERLQAVWARVEAEPKSMRWKARARIGERTSWYEEPEEIAHDRAAGALAGPAA